MPTLLLIKSSLFNGAGQSSQLADDYAQRWQARHEGSQLVVRDLSQTPVPHLTAEMFQGFQAEASERSPEQQAAVALSDALIAEMNDADEIVLALPMYNFTVPSTFKAWMDHVARAGVTFKYTESGPVGLVGPKPMLVFAARGGQYQANGNDTQTPLIKQFFGMLGFDQIDFIYAEGLAFGEEAAASSLAAARQQLLARFD